MLASCNEVHDSVKSVAGEETWHCADTSTVQCCGFEPRRCIEQQEQCSVDSAPVQACGQHIGHPDLAGTLLSICNGTQTLSIVCKGHHGSKCCACCDFTSVHELVEHYSQALTLEARTQARGCDPDSKIKIHGVNCNGSERKNAESPSRCSPRLASLQSTRRACASGTANTSRACGRCLLVFATLARCVAAAMLHGCRSPRNVLFLTRCAEAAGCCSKAWANMLIADVHALIQPGCLLAQQQAHLCARPTAHRLKGLQKMTQPAALHFAACDFPPNARRRHTIQGTPDGRSCCRTMPQAMRRWGQLAMPEFTAYCICARTFAPAGAPSVRDVDF